MPDIIVIAHNIRSSHNIGAILRTCDGFGVTKILLTGYSPYPRQKQDERLPHLADKITAQIHKTALGAELMVPNRHSETIPIDELKADGYVLAGLEQDTSAIPLPAYKPPQKIALLLGEEVDGINSDLLSACDVLLEIPMQGKKESFNVSVAAGIALYGLTVNT